MNSTAANVTCSKSRLASVIRKLNTKGYHSLNAAEMMVLDAHDAETLTVVSDDHLVNGQKVGSFYQVSE